jgi:hypothetical protein
VSLGDSGDAVRAKAQLARRHADEVRAQAQAQRTRAIAQRKAEARAVQAVRDAAQLDGALVRCTRCNAVWRTEAVKEAMRRRSACLLCGGTLVAAPDD